MMTGVSLYLSLLFYTSALCCVWSLYQEDYYLSYPLILSGTMLYFIIPGLLGVVGSNLFSPAQLDQGAFYALACLGMGVFGWRVGRGRERLITFRRGHLSRAWVRGYAIVAILSGGFFLYKLSRVDRELLAQAQWSGPHTIYLFLSSSVWLAIPVLALLFFRTKAVFDCFLLLLAVAAVVPKKVIEGRRDEIVELLVLIGILAGSVLKIRIPRLAILLGMAALGVVFSQIGKYREVARREGVGQALRESATEFHVDDSQPVEYRYGEVVNWLATMEVVQSRGSFSKGLMYWNRLVMLFVPAQFAGRDFKESLIFEEVEITRDDIISTGRISTQGTTFTGLSDTFVSFWYFGSLVFYGTGFALGRLSVQVKKGSFLATAAYPPLLVGTGVGLTHGTDFALGVVVNVLLFQFFWLWLGVRENELDSEGDVIELT